MSKLAAASMPMLATTVGLQLGSMLMNSMAKRKQQRARDAYLQAQEQRLTGLMDEATTEHVNPNIQQYGEDERATQEEALGAELERVALENELPHTTISEEAVGPQGNNAVMVGALERARAPEEAFAAQQGEAMRKMRTGADSLFRLGLDTARTGRHVGKLGSFMQGSAGPLQLELEAADQEGQGLRNLGDLFQVGAQVAGGGIMGGGGPAAGGWNLMTKSAPYAGPGGIMMRSF